MRLLSATTAALLAAFAFSACSDSADNSPAGPNALGPSAESPQAAARPARGFSVPLNLPVTSQGTAGTVTGTLQITRLALNSAGQLVASGLLSGASTTGQRVTNQRVTNIPVALDPQTCPILHLDLGPIFLNLLGLRLTVSEIVVDLTAVPGNGNLLGNLLCAIANLLNQNPLNLGALNNLLAQINQILQTLGL